METSTRINNQLDAAMKAAAELKKSINELASIEEETDYFNYDLQVFDKIDTSTVLIMEKIGELIGAAAFIDAINNTNKKH